MASRLSSVSGDEDSIATTQETWSPPGSPLKSPRLSKNYKTEEIRGILFKKTRVGKWQKRWFETNGCFLTYYKKKGQKLLAALNLPQVGAITLLGEDSADGPGLFTIELNERVYTIKARSHAEAQYWVDALIWRQQGGVVTQKSPTQSPKRNANLLTESSAQGTSAAGDPSSRLQRQMQSHSSSLEDELGPSSSSKVSGCAPCCVIQ